MEYNTDVQVYFMCREILVHCLTNPIQNQPDSYPIFHHHGLMLFLLSSMAKKKIEMFTGVAHDITVLSVEEVNTAHTHFNKEKMNLSGAVMRAQVQHPPKARGKLPLPSSVDFSM